MPLVRQYTFADGEVKTSIDPDYERRYREMLMEISTKPGYKNDPTYDLKRRKPKI